MKMLITIVLITLAIFFLAQISIELHPLKISFGRPYFAIGWILIVIGIALIQIDSESKGYKKAYDEATKIVNTEFSKLKTNTDEIPPKN
jgi:hypothetical protein